MTKATKIMMQRTIDKIWENTP